MLFFAFALQAADWIEFRSGPFVVMTNDGEKQGRETLNYLEQLRYALGTQLGQPDLPSVWPIRVVMLKDAKSGELLKKTAFGRDSWMCSTTELGPDSVAPIVGILLDSWQGTVPAQIERGLTQLYSTLQVDGTRVTLGAVPAQKDRDWSRAHMLTVLPEYSGKMRVLLFNLGKGVDKDVAYRNAFEKTPEEIESALNQYIEAGSYGTYPVSGRPLNLRKELLPKKVEPAAVALYLADLQLAAGNPTARASYEALRKQLPESIEAQEGLGMLAAKASETERAATLLANAKSAAALVDYAKLQPDPVQRRAALIKASAANKLWAEPHRMLAAMDTDPARKLASLRTATQLDPHNGETWIQLAGLQEANKQFAEAAKSWAAAERTADDAAGRDRIRQARSAMERRRVEQQIADRDEARRKAEQEIQDLKNRALTEIRAAEARANAGKPVIDASTLPEYKEEKPKKIAGSLQRVECLGGNARLYVATGRKVVRLLVADPGRVAIAGGGEKALSCGMQKPATSVVVEYLPAATAGVLGEVVTIEFR